MRAASADQSFIDYTILMFGVRVRRDSCRSIVRTTNGWEEYGLDIPLPLSIELLEQGGAEDWGDLVPNLMEYERLAAAAEEENGGEPRALLTGSIDFETALSGGQRGLQ